MTQHRLRFKDIPGFYEIVPKQATFYTEQGGLFKWEVVEWVHGLDCYRLKYSSIGILIQKQNINGWFTVRMLGSEEIKSEVKEIMSIYGW